MGRIAVITGSRADYGIYQPVLAALGQQPGLETVVVAAGMHLSETHGATWRQIAADGHTIGAKVPMDPPDDSPVAMAKALAAGLAGMADALSRLAPDMVLVLGDRGEMLAAALAAVHLDLPVAHIHGGEVSGSVDDYLRHAISKLAHLHFTATMGSARRLAALGEESWRIHVVGAPRLDTILRQRPLPRDRVWQELGLDPSQTTALVVQHPVTQEVEAAAEQMGATLAAVRDLDLQAIVLYPNTDAGGRVMLQAIQNLTAGMRNVRLYPTLPPDLYLSVLANIDVMIGNSSSGIIEAPSFRVPVVNVGSRQWGRERAENVVDVDHDRRAITGAVRFVLHDKDFRRRLAQCSNPYGDGRAAERIAQILARPYQRHRLLRKAPPGGTESLGRAII